MTRGRDGTVLATTPGIERMLGPHGNADAGRCVLAGESAGAAHVAAACAEIAIKNAIRIAFQKANLFLATAVLRLDFANSLVNIISTPIMLGTELRSIKSLIAKDPETAGKLAELTRIKVPGQEASVPGMGKLIGGAINNFFGPQKAQLLQRYKDNGDIKDVLTLYHDVLDDLSYMPNRAPSEWASKVEKAVEKGATITEHELVDWGKEQMAAYKSPRIVTFVDGLPMTSTGKILKRDIDLTPLFEKGEPSA